MEEKNTVQSPNSPRLDEVEGQPLLGHCLVIGPSDNSESCSKDDTPSSSMEQDVAECVDLESPSFSLAELSQKNGRKSLSCSKDPLSSVLKKDAVSDTLVGDGTSKLKTISATSPSAAAVLCSPSKDSKKASHEKTVAAKKLRTLRKMRTKNAGNRALRLQQARRSCISKQSPGLAKNALPLGHSDSSTTEQRSRGVCHSRSVRFSIADSQALKSSHAQSPPEKHSELSAVPPCTSNRRILSEPIGFPKTLEPSSTTSPSQKQTCQDSCSSIDGSASEASHPAADSLPDTLRPIVGDGANATGQSVEDSVGSRAEKSSLLGEESHQTDLLTDCGDRTKTLELNPCNPVLSVGMDINDPADMDLSESLDFEEELEISSFHNVPSLSPLTNESLGLASDDGESIVLADNETENPSEADKVFSYLQSLPVLRLRAFCKELKVKQSGNESILVDRVFFALSEQGAGEECTWDLAARDLARTCEARDYNGWLLDNGSRDVWQMAPSPEEGVCEETAIPNFSLDEYARLLVLLTTNDSLRSALIQSGLERERAQIDLHIPRERFWVVKVEPVFNDANVKPVMDFTGQLSNVDCSKKPRAYRTGVELKKQYEFVKGHFTTAYADYSKSGNFDPKNFDNFCDKTSCDDSKLSAIGKKCYLMFLVYGCGTEHQRDDIMEFTLRTMRQGLSVDTGERSNNGLYESSLKKERAEARKKRTELVDRVGTITEHMSAMVNTLAQGNDSSEEMALIEKRLRLQESLRNSMEMYKMRNECPEYVRQFIEREMREAVEKLEGK